MKKIWRVILVAIVLLTACSNGVSPTEKPTESLPTPVIQTTSLPDASATAMEFLEKWNSADYAGMYQMLAPTSRDAITEEEFSKTYSDVAINLTLTEIEYGVLTALINPTSAKIGYQVNFKTRLFGDIQRQMEMNLVAINGSWRIQWESGMILPELSGGKKLALKVTQPARGEIYDRNGNIIATNTEAVSLGVVRGQISDSQEESLVVQLSELTGIPRNMVIDLYENSDADAYTAIGEVSKEGYDKRAATLDQFSGLVVNEYSSRYYYNGGIAPQVTGYLRYIFPEEYDEYRRMGYAGDEKIGAAGLEKWGEDYLKGKPAAELYVVNQDGTYSTRLEYSDPQAADTIYTTFDKNFQLLVQKALYGFTGAIVVLERDTGRVLAMASSPGYDPNVFQSENYNSQYVLNDLLNDEDTPMWNRATQSAYPLGSVFKLITMAAALESGLYTPDSTYECTSQYTELPGFVGNDWTYDKELPPSGTLTLVDGLMRSCNPWFYHLGLDLYRQKGATYLSDFAREFGLGEATGIEAVAEEVGSINDPTTEGAAVQMGIGQGDMLVTPLQVASFVAAIGNGGTLYRPQIIEKVTTIDGDIIEEFKPEVRNQLPVSQETLDAIWQGMYKVVRDERGTAYRRFIGMQTSIYAKTGTATTSIEDPHSWFAGFTNSNNPEKPDIAVAVIAEYAGDGSAVAAPIFRRVIEAYFTGDIYTTYPWEQTFYLTKTPTTQGE